MKQVYLFWLMIGLGVAFSCDTETGKKADTPHVAFYTLKNQNTLGTGCELDVATAQEKEVIIANDEILSYHAAEHYFVLTAAAVNRLKNIKNQTPFYLKVDNAVVYAGFLMPGYLSLACLDIIVIDPLAYNNIIRVRYDYANTSQPTTDSRNNATLLAALQNQGKLEK
ncbi:hypothetical protein [Adhaeribacter pallidiroseus]|uniref:Lipoprotein n=1 Tax=Adhaeribacter pallidiroseus TaxID=2072847 RepID=A0A369QP00_9BACT|nr:hypothetical protein [Adhaeribacter pallidiroseus]RDC64987.1 hypothetical protein AHMF7616_03609 [Adhaeribacter pallidiroseus]